MNYLGQIPTIFILPEYGLFQPSLVTSGKNAENTPSKTDPEDTIFLMENHGP